MRQEYPVGPNYGARRHQRRHRAREGVGFVGAETSDHLPRAERRVGHLDFAGIVAVELDRRRGDRIAVEHELAGAPRKGLVELFARRDDRHDRLIRRNENAAARRDTLDMPFVTRSEAHTSELQSLMRTSY